MNLHDALIKEDQRRQREVNDPAHEAQVLLKEQGLKEEDAIKQLGLREVCTTFMTLNSVGCGICI